MKNLLTILLLLLSASTIIVAQSWTPINLSISTQATVGPISPIDENVCWASWTTGYTSASQTKNGFIRTTDGGETWSGGELTDYDGGLCEWMEAIDANTAFIAIQNYMKSGVQGIYKTTDGGVTWQKHPTAFAGSSIGPAYIHFFDSNNGVVVGDKDAKTAGFRIYTTTNGGTEWNVVPQSNIPPLFSGEMLQPTPNGEFMDCIWLSTFPASGHTARIFKTTDKGFHWSVITPSGLTNSHLLSLAFQSATTGMMVAFSQMGSVIKKTKDGGETWTIVNGLDKCSPLFICHVQGADSAYLIGGNRNFMGYANGGSAYTLNDGETWTAIDTGDYAYPVFISPNIGWCGSFGENKIYKSSDIIINSITSVKEDIKSGKINSFSLEQNFPNPFNPSTTIRYSVKQSSNVNITILNAIGQVVTTLLNEEKSPGEYQVNFNASSLPSGVYFYRIKAGEYTSVKKMVLMK